MDISTMDISTIVLALLGFVLVSLMALLLPLVRERLKAQLTTEQVAQAEAAAGLLYQLALLVVESNAQQKISGSEAKNRAVRLVADALAGYGISLPVSLISEAVEAAVRNMKYESRNMKGEG